MVIYNTEIVYLKQLVLHLFTLLLKATVIGYIHNTNIQKKSKSYNQIHIL